MKLALDTSNVLGSGAGKDTYNLLADGIGMLIRELARLAGRRPHEWASGSFRRRRQVAEHRLALFGPRLLGPASRASRLSS